MQVLVVDDNEDLAWVLTRMVRRLGHEVVACITPKAALDAVRSWRPDLVLLDIDLPDLDGYTLAVLLRHRGLPHARMVAVSSHEDDPIKRSAASIDAHYMKPDALRRIGEILATQDCCGRN